jgi:zinc transporter, ZIP family
MESGSVAAETRRGRRLGATRWRLLALVPIILLVGVVSLFASVGGSFVDLVGSNPPPADEFDVRRVEFKPGEIRVHVRNPQPDDLTIALVTVDDAIVPFEVEGSATLGRLASREIVVPFDWVPDDPYLIGVTSSSGIQTVEEVPAAVETKGASPEGFLGYALIGFLVGVVPVALGLAWLPSLRRASPKWLAAFMALTAGLLTFIAIEALAEALELQGALPGSLQGTGLILLGVSASYLALTWISMRFSAKQTRERAPSLGGLALATLVAIGIGLHNLGEGLAIGSSFALTELALGTFLVIGFMIHNVTEGLGIAAPIAEGGRVSLGRLAVLAVIAGAPAIVGAWIGGFLTNELVAVLFFAIAVGAALQVVVEVGRFIARRAPGGLSSGYVIGGFLAGLAIMYGTGLIAG